MSQENVDVVRVIHERFAQGETAEVMEHLIPRPTG
jgi:hypothetical protein